MADPTDDQAGTGAGHDDAPEVSLETSVSNLLEEARMLLPGTQTLFGFQLAVVFTGAFYDRLAPVERSLHLLGMVLTAVAIALLMAPAAYHRVAEPESVSRRFVHLATRQLVSGTVPLAVAICLEAYLVASVVTGRTWLSIVVAGALLVVFAVLWYVVPTRARAGR